MKKKPLKVKKPSKKDYDFIQRELVLIQSALSLRYQASIESGDLKAAQEWKRLREKFA